jgi:general secretion pathway protein F
MAAYEYLAMCAAGKKSSGVLEADSPRQARQMLRERQLIALKITTSQGHRSTVLGEVKTAGGGLSSAELALLTRQLATLVQASLPLEEVLAAVAAQCEKQRV